MSRAARPAGYCDVQPPSIGPKMGKTVVRLDIDGLTPAAAARPLIGRIVDAIRSAGGAPSAQR